VKDKIIFSGQNNDEKVIKVSNRHPFTFFRDAVGSFVLFFASLAAMLVFFYVPYVLPVAFVVFVFSIIGGFYSYFTWERDKFIITDQRVVDIEQKTLFMRSQKETYLDKIQDVSFDIKGFWGSIFHYGTVNIQTASGTSLTLDDIHQPEVVQKMILELIKENESYSDDEGLFEKMTEMIRKAIQDQKPDEGK